MSAGNSPLWPATLVRTTDRQAMNPALVAGHTRLAGFRLPETPWAIGTDFLSAGWVLLAAVTPLAWCAEVEADADVAYPASDRLKSEAAASPVTARIAARMGRARRLGAS